jgi:predicted transcriptional regulator
MGQEKRSNKKKYFQGPNKLRQSISGSPQWTKAAAYSQAEKESRSIDKVDDDDANCQVSLFEAFI